MATCIHITVPTPPQLPTTFGFVAPPLPGVPDITLCCQIRLQDYLPDVPPIPFIGLTSATVNQINQIMVNAQTAVQNYVDQLVPNCPVIKKYTNRIMPNYHNAVKDTLPSSVTFDLG